MERPCGIKFDFRTSSVMWPIHHSHHSRLSFPGDEIYLCPKLWWDDIHQFPYELMSHWDVHSSSTHSASLNYSLSVSLTFNCWSFIHQSFKKHIDKAQQPYRYRNLEGFVAPKMIHLCLLVSCREQRQRQTDPRTPHPWQWQKGGGFISHQIILFIWSNHVYTWQYLELEISILFSCKDTSLEICHVFIGY